jgi:hypothetical protein
VIFIRSGPRRVGSTLASRILEAAIGMLVVETIDRIGREHFVHGKSIKEIARDLRLSRNTVRKVLRSNETSFCYERRVQPRPKLGRWKEHSIDFWRRTSKRRRESDSRSFGYTRSYAAPALRAATLLSTAMRSPSARSA